MQAGGTWQLCSRGPGRDQAPCLTATGTVSKEASKQARGKSQSGVCRARRAGACASASHPQNMVSPSALCQAYYAMTNLGLSDIFLACAAHSHIAKIAHTFLHHACYRFEFRVNAVTQQSYLPNMLQLALQFLPDKVIDGVLHVQHVDVDAAGLPYSVRPVLCLDQISRRPGVLSKHNHRCPLHSSQS